jgi:hypothetical protein
VQVVVNIGMFQVAGGGQIRRVREIAFVTGVVEGETLQQEKIFRWDVPRGRPAHEGRLVMTQARPTALIARLEGAIPGFQWERDVVGKHYDSFEPASPDVSRFSDGRRA